MSGKGGWRRLQRAVGSEHQGPASHLEPGKGPHCLSLASTFPSVKRDRQHPLCCSDICLLGLSLCPSEKMATIQIRKWSCWPESPEGSEPDHSPSPAPTPLGNCTSPPLGKAQRVRAIKHNSALPGPLFRPNHPRGRGKRGPRCGGSDFPLSSQTNPRLLGSGRTAWPRGS